MGRASHPLSSLALAPGRDSPPRPGATFFLVFMMIVI
jgi:hypothetical protein